MFHVHVIQLSYPCFTFNIFLVIVVDHWAAALIGAIGGPLYIGASKLVWSWKVDDPVDAAAVHFFGGMYGLVRNFFSLFSDTTKLISFYPPCCDNFFNELNSSIIYFGCCALFISISAVRAFFSHLCVSFMIALWFVLQISAGVFTREKFFRQGYLDTIYPSVMEGLFLEERAWGIEKVFNRCLIVRKYRNERSWSSIFLFLRFFFFVLLCLQSLWYWTCNNNWSSIWLPTRCCHLHHRIWNCNLHSVLVHSSKNSTSL